VLGDGQSRRSCNKGRRRGNIERIELVAAGAAVSMIVEEQALIRVAFWRMMRAAPETSSTVSPFMRSALWINEVFARG
jgi:hypothetical protein